MDFLGKVHRPPKKKKKTLRDYYPLTFGYSTQDRFNEASIKAYKILAEEGRCVIEDLNKSKYIIDIEQINCDIENNSMNVLICGCVKIK